MRGEDGLHLGCCEEWRPVHDLGLVQIGLDLRHPLFTTILCTPDKLHLDLHGESSRLGHTD